MPGCNVNPLALCNVGENCKAPKVCVVERAAVKVKAVESHNAPRVIVL